MDIGSPDTDACHLGLSEGGVRCSLIKNDCAYYVFNIFPHYTFEHKRTQLGKGRAHAKSESIANGESRGRQSHSHSRRGWVSYDVWVLTAPLSVSLTAKVTVKWQTPKHNSHRQSDSLTHVDDSQTVTRTHTHMTCEWVTLHIDTVSLTVTLSVSLTAIELAYQY